MWTHKAAEGHAQRFDLTTVSAPTAGDLRTTFHLGIDTGK
jgi:hypothetical protein